MSAFRILAIALGGVIAIPVLVLNIWGLRMTGYVIEQTTANDSYLATGVVPDTPPMPRSPLQFLRDRSALRDTFTPETLTEQRLITVTAWVTPADMLSPAEALPQPALWPLYAEARAPHYMMRFCTEVIASFGTACEITRTTAEIARDGRTVLTATMAYLPAADLGDTGAVSNGDLLAAPVLLYDVADIEKPAFTADSRIAAMQKAQSLCDNLRDTFGNCVVTRLDLQPVALWPTDLERLPAGTDPVRLQATAVVKVFADTDHNSNDSLRQIARALTLPD